MLGIDITWECQSCGALIRTQSPFWNKDVRKKLAEPKRCSCGQKTNFQFIGIAPCEFEVVPNGYKIVKQEDTK